MIGSKVVLLPMRVMGVLIGYFTLLSSKNGRYKSIAFIPAIQGCSVLEREAPPVFIVTIDFQWITSFKFVPLYWTIQML